MVKLELLGPTEVAVLWELAALVAATNTTPMR
jgi:hypothetical protein